MTDNKLRLGVNIDHVATVRNARGGVHPKVIDAAKLSAKAGADGVTAHLREDRRHIIDSDIFAIKSEVDLPLNLEMAATEEMLQIALKVKPNAVCLVPEKREELTTEGGLDIINNKDRLKDYILPLKENNIRVSLFLESDIEIVDAALELQADIIEFHTGKFCNLAKNQRFNELQKIIKAVNYADNLGIECHAGHGLNYETVGDIAKISQIKELNIGHFIIGEAIFYGLENAIGRMRALMDEARR